MSNYFVVDENGESELPTFLQAQESRRNGRRPILFLDSSVCMEIVRFVDYKRKANVDRYKLLHFHTYIRKNKSEVTPLLGLIELCTNKETFQIDEKKFIDFKHKIDFWKELPAKMINGYNFDYDRDYFIYKDINLREYRSVEIFRPMLLQSYCCLLKIRYLAITHGLNKKVALKNIEYFIDWMETDLGKIMGIEYKIAINIFGGLTAFRKMIGIDNTIDDVKKIVWGTSWDIFHSRISCNSHRISRMLKDNIISYFVTKDTVLYKLLSEIALKIVINAPTHSTSTNMLMSTFRLSHLNINDLTVLNDRMLKLLLNRYSLEKKYNEERLRNIISDLEILNKIKGT